MGLSTVPKRNSLKTLKVGQKIEVVDKHTGEIIKAKVYLVGNYRGSIEICFAIPDSKVGMIACIFKPPIKNHPNQYSIYRRFK